MVMSVEYEVIDIKEHPGSVRGKAGKFDDIVEDCLKLPVDTMNGKKFILKNEKAANAMAAIYTWVSEHKDSPFRFKCSKLDDHTFRVWKVSK